MPENETTHFTTLMQFVEWVKQLVSGEYLLLSWMDWSPYSCKYFIL